MTSQTFADKALLDTVNHYLDQPVAWQLITSKGTTNRLYRGQIPNQSLILRVNAGEDWAFGVSRETEAQVLELIQGYVWAPKVVKNNWQDGWCLMQDHGDSPPSLTINTQLLAAISEWQLVQPGNIAPFNYTALFNTYRQHIDALADSSSKQHQLGLLGEIIRRLDKLPAVPQSLTHHDLHIDNICGNDSTLVILDWEYAGFGNPLFDAAALFSQLGVSATNIAKLPSFSHLDKALLEQALVDTSLIASQLETLWRSIRRQP